MPEGWGSAPRDLALLVNPTSGGGRGARAGLTALQVLREAGASVRVLVGRDAAEAADLGRKAVDRGAEALVAVGGDGMVHLALQLLARSGAGGGAGGGAGDVPLGLVPAGTGNDFARALGLPRRDPAAAARVVLAGVARAVDLGRVETRGAGERWFGCVAAAGFDARVNDRAERMRWPRGRSRYPLAVVPELRVLRPRAYGMEVDGDWRELAALLVSVANAPSYGGGMRVAPAARLDDGELDLLVVRPLPRAEFLRVFPTVYRGTHVTHPAVELRRARRIVLDAPGTTVWADGERVGPLPATFTAVPGAVRVLVPPAGGDPPNG